MSDPVLIYGASGGIGSALARQLRAAGRPVHLAGRNAAVLAPLAAELDAPYTVADVLEPEAFARVQADAGPRLSGLVYAVGSITLRSLGRLSAEDFLRDYRLNALGAALAVQAAVPALKAAECGASVVLFSSVAAGTGFPMHASVAMAKGAVEGLTRALAAELAPRIRVNAIAPSLTRTGLSAGLLANEKAAQALAELHPLPRVGEPEDAAALGRFLLSPDAAWITGQVMAVDGGVSAVHGGA